LDRSGQLQTHITSHNKDNAGEPVLGFDVSDYLNVGGILWMGYLFINNKYW
jgi:hypothetical protein